MKKQVEMEWALDANGECRHISDRSMDEGGYKCICCGNEAITARGQVQQHHFRHKAGEFDRDNYIHNLAQYLVCEDLRNWSQDRAAAPKLGRKTSGLVNWLTTSRFHDLFNFPEELRPDSVEMEIRFQVPGSSRLRRPDIALLRGDEIIAIVEICHTNEVKDDRLWDYNSIGIPWVELKAVDVLNAPEGGPWPIRQCSRGFDVQKMDYVSSPLAIGAELMVVSAILNVATRRK